MWLVDRRFKGIPVSFLIVVLATILLTIFFGAWAVSADASAQGRDFSFGLGAASPSLSGLNDDGSPGSSVPAGQEDADLADEWWGQALLKACPFH